MDILLVKLGVANLTLSCALNALNLITWIHLFQTRWTKVSGTIMFQIIANLVHTILFYISVFESHNMNFAWTIFDGIGYIAMSNLTVWMLRDRYAVFAVSRSDRVAKTIIILGIIHFGIIASDAMTFCFTFYFPVNWTLINKIGIATKVLTFSIEIFIDWQMYLAIKKNSTVGKAQTNELLWYLAVVVALSISELCYANLVHFSFDVLSKCPIYAFKTLFVLKLFEGVMKDAQSRRGTPKNPTQGENKVGSSKYNSNKPVNTKERESISV